MPAISASFFGFDVFSYDESGRVYCTCPSEKRGEDERRELAFVFDCEGRNECEKLSPVGAFDFGRIRIGQAENMRPLVAPIERAA